jgi:NAD(P)-dependent dehydrogenase (short-subunit alcohol dehydrogenase family)
MAAVNSDLAGKVVLVTGGASGIGAAIVRRFAQQKSMSRSSTSRPTRSNAWHASCRIKVSARISSAST